MATIFNPAFKAVVPITQLFGGAHLGFDSASAWGASVGHPIYALERGKVVESNLVYGTYGWINTSGNYIAVRHPGIPEHYFVTTGKHLNSRTVSVGANVTSDTQVGTEGKTGTATGVHLHQDVFEYKDGQLNRRDPKPFILNPSLLIVADEQTCAIPVYATYEATDNLKIRSGAGTDYEWLANGTALINKGEQFVAINLAVADGYAWAEHDAGWSALGEADGSPLWVKAIVTTDGSARIAILEAENALQQKQIAQQRGTISGLTVSLTNERLETKRLEDIIAEAAAALAKS